MTKAGKEGIGNKPEDVFSGKLREVVGCITGAIDAAGIEDNILIPRLVKTRSGLQRNLLLLYEEFQRDYTGQAWGEFVREYQKAKEASSDGKVKFYSNPRRLCFELPRVSPHDFDGNCLPVPNAEKTKRNIEYTTGLARELGVLDKDETWADYINRPEIYLVGMNDYKKAERIYMLSCVLKDYDYPGIEGSNIIQRMEHKDINMVEFPYAPSEKFPGIALGIKFYPVKYRDTTPIEQLIKDGKAYGIMSFSVPTDILLQSA